MKSFLKTRSVHSGMVWLLDTYCEKNHFKSPVNQIYDVEDRVILHRWLKKLKYIDRQYQKDGLGFEIAKLCNFSHIGIAYYIAASCENLQSYVDLSLQYISVWYDFMNKDVRDHGETVSISWEKPAYYSAGLYVRETAISEELQVAIIFKVLKSLLGVEKPFVEVHLAIPTPQNIKNYEDYFSCPISFSTERTLFKIPKKLFLMPFESADPVLLQILQKQAEIAFNKMPKHSKFLDSVHRAILKSIEIQDPKVAVVAGYLNMNARTLQALLKENGVSFQDLLNKSRLELAKQYLLKKNVSVLEVSRLLGFKEQTSFNRVFKSWTGYTPIRWRDSNIDIFSSELNQGLLLKDLKDSTSLIELNLIDDLGMRKT